VNTTTAVPEMNPVPYSGDNAAVTLGSIACKLSLSLWEPSCQTFLML